ncbi:hypothetical protein [Parapedobacter tibetensis]|nr:hypothetical protein [Parapedobacter tibetensis]
MAIILVSHRERALQLADRILHLEDGHLTRPTDRTPYHPHMPRETTQAGSAPDRGTMRGNNTTEAPDV